LAVCQEELTSLLSTAPLQRFRLRASLYGVNDVYQARLCCASLLQPSRGIDAGWLKRPSVMV
jgi:hypothetical protein